jgi:hypothetical protein
MAHPPYDRLLHLWALCRVRCHFFLHTGCGPTLSSIGLVLAFTIPRVPAFNINGQTPLVSATGSFNQSISAGFSRFPANFSFPGAVSLQVDTSSNFLPLVFKHLDAQVYDLDTFNLVGTGYLNHTTLPAKSFSSIQMPINFTYVATNDSDQTCKSALLLQSFSRI